MAAPRAFLRRDEIRRHLYSKYGDNDTGGSIMKHINQVSKLRPPVKAAVPVVKEKPLKVPKEGKGGME